MLHAQFVITPVMPELLLVGRSSYTPSAVHFDTTHAYALVFLDVGAFISMFHHLKQLRHHEEACSQHQGDEDEQALTYDERNGYNAHTTT